MLFYLGITYIVKQSAVYLSLLVNKANLVHNFSQYVYFFSLHVSGDYVPIVRRNNCIYATLGNYYSVWMTVGYAYQTVIHTVSHKYSYSS